MCTWALYSLTNYFDCTCQYTRRFRSSCLFSLFQSEGKCNSFSSFTSFFFYFTSDIKGLAFDLALKQGQRATRSGISTTVNVIITDRDLAKHRGQNKSEKRFYLLPIILKLTIIIPIISLPPPPPQKKRLSPPENKPPKPQMQISFQ